jgi:hypothetical protein
MPKKAKGRKKKKGKRLGKKGKEPTYAYVKPRRVATAGQLNQVHNQALKNAQRDNAELAREVEAQKQKQKNERLELEKEVMTRKLEQLNPYVIDV